MMMKERGQASRDMGESKRKVFFILPSYSLAKQPSHPWLEGHSVLVEASSPKLAAFVSPQPASQQGRATSDLSFFTSLV